MNNIEQAISFARQEYTRQGLDALYQKDFEEALLPALSQAAEIYRADTLRWSGDPKTDLLAALLWSQKLLNDYQRHQLPDEVFYHTIDDIGRWASEYWSYSGKIGLAESAWLTNHLTLRLFQLGRLQFCMEPADFSAPAFGLEPGEPLVSVHICRGGSLDPAACDTSFARARAFFPKHFPAYAFRFFSCHSWLLDETLLPLVGVYSNISFFQQRFQIVGRTASNAAARYVLRWDIQPDEIAAFVPQNRFQSQCRWEECDMPFMKPYMGRQNPSLVIMAEGMGSRFGGLKQIEPADPEGHIIIDFSLFDAWRAGFRDVVFIIKREMEAEFRECFGGRPSIFWPRRRTRAAMPTAMRCRHKTDKTGNCTNL